MVAAGAAAEAVVEATSAATWATRRAILHTVRAMLYTLSHRSSLPGDLRHGVEHAANTTRNVTYLVVAGAIITGAIYAYRH